MDVPLPPLLPGLFPSTNNMIRGSGILSWLSPKAGLINCSKPMHATVSFQIKDFCDSGVTDLTQFLRVGFRLAFHAIPNNTSEWIANYVSPINEQDLANGVVNDGQELNLEQFEQNNMPPGKAGKDTYSLEKEMRALSFLLQIFQKNSVHYLQLSNLHSRISNSGDPELSRYIGSSSLKRRQFIEDRSYIFYLTESDAVFLQSPDIYQTVTLLATFLLKHGGVTSSDLLYSFFNKHPAIPVAIKELIQNPPKAARPQFMQFLTRHPFAFAPFPSQYYVGVRRNLPVFDYATFIRRSFPNFNQSRPMSRPLLSTNESFEGQLSPVEGPGGLPLSSLQSAANPLANAHSLSGLTNGFTANGHGGHGASSALGGGGAINGLGSSKGSLSQPYLHQAQHQPVLTPTTQKPIFSLFDDPIVPNPGSAINPVQNGIRSIMGGTGSGGGNSNGTSLGSAGAAANIWTPFGGDMDLLDRAKITDVFVNDFKKAVSLGDQSPPRKQFVEKEVQTDESIFGSCLCSNCGQKVNK